MSRIVNVDDAQSAQDAVPLHQVQDIAAAAAVPATAGAVALGGHAGFSLLGKASTGSGNAADIPVGTDSVSGRIGSGNVGDIPMTAAGRAMAGAASATAQTALLDAVSSAAKGLAPASGGGTTNFLRADGAWTVPPGAPGSGITSLTSDVAATGPGAAAAIIQPGVVTNAKSAAMSNGRIKARITAGAGDPEDATATQVTALLDTVTSGAKGLAPASGGGTANFLRADGTWVAPPGIGGVTSLTGDVTGAGPGAAATTIANDAVSNAKSANMANGTIKARITAGTGDPEDATGTQVTALLDVVGSAAKGLAPASGGGSSNFLRADGSWVAPPIGVTALTGDVTGTGPGSTATTIANGAVTNAKRANMAASSISGNATGSPAAPTDLTAAAVKTLLAISFGDLTGSLAGSQFPGISGVVNVSPGGFSSQFGAAPAKTILSNPAVASAVPDFHDVPTIRTMLGLNSPQHFDLLLSFGTGDGNNADSVTPQSAGPGNWPFFLLPNTRNSDIPNNAYAAGNHDANLATPAAVNEWRVTGAYGTVELSIEVQAVIGIGGGGSVVFILAKNGLLDASPCIVTITSTGFFSSGVISLGAFSFTGADRASVRAQVLGGSVGAQLKATVTAHFTP